MRSSYTDETRVKLKYYHKIKIYSIKKSDFFYVCPLEKNYDNFSFYLAVVAEKTFKYCLYKGIILLR